MNLLTKSFLGIFISFNCLADSVDLSGTYLARKQISNGNVPDCKTTGARPFRFISGPLNNRNDSEIAVLNTPDLHLIVNYVEDDGVSNAKSRVWVDTNRLLPSTNTEDAISYRWNSDGLIATYKTVSYPDMHKEVLILSYSFSLDANGNLKVVGDAIAKSGILDLSRDHSHVDCVYQRKSH